MSNVLYQIIDIIVTTLPLINLDFCFLLTVYITFYANQPSCQRCEAPMQFIAKRSMATWIQVWHGSSFLNFCLDVGPTLEWTVTIILGNKLVMCRENVPFGEHPSQVCVKFRQQRLEHRKQPIMKQLDCCQKIKRNTLYDRTIAIG